MPSIASAYRGPLLIMGLGGGFSVVGAVPVAITFSIGYKTSATIIGMGFIGFGFLLILPGLFWCLMVRTHSFKFWRRRGRRTEGGAEGEEGEEVTPALRGEARKPIKPETNNRPRRWPPAYVEVPPLIITDHTGSADLGGLPGGDNPACIYGVIETGDNSLAGVENNVGAVHKDIPNNICGRRFSLERANACCRDSDEERGVDVDRSSRNTEVLGNIERNRESSTTPTLFHIESCSSSHHPMTSIARNSEVINVAESSSTIVDDGSLAHDDVCRLDVTQTSDNDASDSYVADQTYSTDGDTGCVGGELSVNCVT